MIRRFFRRDCRYVAVPTGRGSPRAPTPGDRLWRCSSSRGCPRLRRLAQADPLTTPPPNLVIANYNSTSVGPYMVDSRAWRTWRGSMTRRPLVQPGRTSRQPAAQISGSAGVAFDDRARRCRTRVVRSSSCPTSSGSRSCSRTIDGWRGRPVQQRVGSGDGLELITMTAGAQQRFAYSADSGFTQRVGAIGVGYRASDSWRVGAGFAFSLMDLRLVQTTSDRIADSTELRSLLVSARDTGSAFQIRAQSGVQYDLGSWRFGGAVRTPGLTLYRSGSVILAGVLADQPALLGASIFDPDARLEYHLPWEFQGGAALSAPGGSGVRSSGLHADRGLSAAVFEPAGADVCRHRERIAVVSSRPFAGLTSASNGVVNLGAGGHATCSKRTRPAPSRGRRFQSVAGRSIRHCLQQGRSHDLEPWRQRSSANSVHGRIQSPEQAPRMSRSRALDRAERDHERVGAKRRVHLLAGVSVLTARAPKHRAPIRNDRRSRSSPRVAGRWR